MQNSPPPFFQRGPSLVMRFALFSLLSLVFLVADARFNYLRLVRQGMAVMIYPLQRGAAMPWESFDRLSGFLAAQAELLADNERLRFQRLRDGAALQTQQSLEAENRHLRELLTLRERLPRETIPAEILFSHRDPFTRRVVVDRGSQNGVVEGSAVVDPTGVVGQVTRVFPWLSEVTLISDKEQAVPIQVVRSGLRGITFGTGYDHGLELRFMPVNADLQNGDVLVTSGIDGTYPPGLPVAVVANVERNVAYAFARIYCSPAAGVSGRGQVLIVASTDRLPPNPIREEELAARRAKREGN